MTFLIFYPLIDPSQEISGGTEIFPERSLVDVRQKVC